MINAILASIITFVSAVVCWNIILKTGEVTGDRGTALLMTAMALAYFVVMLALVWRGAL